ncbi:response regulator [Cesiribacter andamanensis]|uniref:histidine kinase n=1 Tax=Cesiribacter andamanensis AMV16 TaxID=1279009 RepID=M7N3F2_9BACT|nr:response regulator [Cesiribacter andamanensis]EMR01802.1 Autoinducer 2 sensor kinase/phosphatase luxQ [Cesiribacter andamanensis AMV16]
MQNLSGYDTREVFELFTKSIEAYKQLEDRMIRRIQAEVEAEKSKRSRQLIGLVAFLLVMLGLAIVLSFYIVNLISTSLYSLKLAAERVRLGATDVKIGITSRDEIGEVADAFRGLVRKSIGLTEVARAIGEGRYDLPVAIQSPEDNLSMAISDMQEKLQRYSTESNRRSWILNGVSELNSLIAGEGNLQELAEKVIAFLCTYTQAEAGVLYLHNDAGRLIPASTYGLTHRLEQIPSFELGAGKVGLAVRENSIKILRQVPDEYLKLQTGLSELQPATVFVLPLVFSGNNVGAIELCSRQEATPLQQEFFKTVSERIAIILHTLQAHVHTQELLYETQNQAEELETQQEELRQLNAELKASEEELKVNQEELQEKNSELEEKAQLLEEQFEAVRTKNQALEDARQAIELKIQQVETVSKYKSEFLANMSHELRTPLNSILILSRLLADNTDDRLSEKQIEQARIIHNSGADLLKLINEILDLSKIESGQIRLEIAPVPLADLKLDKVFSEMASNKNVAFSMRLAPDLPESIRTDRFRLEQILKNFISNAIKFTPAGGSVELSIYPLAEAEGKAGSTGKESGTPIAFSVKDTGIGIPKDKQDLIFEAFQQADSSTTRKFGGTGLGLAISRELANLLGGQIRLQSEQGKGSTFTLIMPQHGQQQEEAPAQTSSRSRVVPALTQSKQESARELFSSLDTRTDRTKKEVCLLIIEDDKGFNGILADFAQAKNFRVKQAFTGRQGLELAREVSPDAVLLDINLPDMSGWEVLQQIREDRDLRHINVHVMSAYDREVVGKHEQNEEYLPKPVTLEMLNKAFTTISATTARSIETTLIVEDNEIENNAIGELLLSHGIHSVSAHSAEEAEKVLAKQKIDCIILDLNLPGMKGQEWMQKIRAKKGLADIPIIIYSGKDLSEEEEISLKRHANTIIIKNEHSYLRLLDEVQLFLHKVNKKLPVGNDFKMKLHVPEEILKGKKILVADDDVRNVYSLCSLLEMQGMEIVVAYNGQEALNKLKAEEEVDLVLMDVMMPEMDGIEAIKHIRRQSRYKQLPIIALTAKAMKEDREKCIAAGASDYIPKPVDTDKLLTLMRVWLYEG